MPRAGEIFGLLAEFTTPEALRRAAAAVYQDGYRRTDAFTPYPMEGLPETLGAGPTRVPLLFLLGGIFGGASGYAMCWYANVISYPWNIGGRPANSWPAWIPLTFELTVLCAGLAGALGMLIANGLPQLHHPLFNVPAFARASQDRFFLCIEAADPRFDGPATRAFLVALRAHSVVEVTW